MTNDREMYEYNLHKSYSGKKKDYQTQPKEKASEKKRKLLDNKFPIYVTANGFIYDIILNSSCEVIFNNGIHSCYYSDVPNKFIEKLRLIL